MFQIGEFSKLTRVWEDLYSNISLFSFGIHRFMPRRVGIVKAAVGAMTAMVLRRVIGGNAKKEK